MQGGSDHHTSMLPSSEAPPAAAAGAKVLDGGEDDRSNSGVVIDHGSGANRWPRQEALALLKIRSDMDSVFRDSSLKAPLWEEVSRKLSELGYNRSAKKCKEKFENVYKYHKRTKEGKTGKSEGKTYKFFDQLQALESQLPRPPPLTTAPTSTPTNAATLPWTNNPPNVAHATIQSKSTNPINVMPLNIFAPSNPTIQSYPYQNNFQSHNTMASNPVSNSTSSSTASDEEAVDEEVEGKRKRKRKLKDLLERVTRDIIDKQEEMQKRFLETIEKQEHDRIVRIEAWRMQEIARINREHEMLIQERSATIAKDNAILTYLQKLSGHQNLQVPASQQPPPPPPPLSMPTQPPLTPITKTDAPKENEHHHNGGNTPSSSRWPKSEIEALINIRTNLENKYQDNGPKGPLWEEISIEMQKLGYNRSAKRCKEKWENINKYFKKVKDNNKKIRSQDSKTCPYFHQLDALYKEKNKIGIDNSIKNVAIQEQKLKQQEEVNMIKTSEGRKEDEHDDKEEDDRSEEDEEDRFEVVANKQGTFMRNLKEVACMHSTKCQKMVQNASLVGDLAEVANPNSDLSENAISCGNLNQLETFSV